MMMMKQNRHWSGGFRQNLFNEDLGETDDLAEAPPSQGDPGVYPAEVIAASNRQCVELAGEEPDTPAEETALAEHSKLQDCAIRVIMLRDEVSDQFAANGASRARPPPWQPSCDWAPMPPLRTANPGWR